MPRKAISQPSSPLFFPGSHHSKLTSAWVRTKKRRGKKNCVLSGERRPSMRTAQETGLSSMTAAFSHPSPLLRQPHFTLLFTYSCNNPLCSFPLPMYYDTLHCLRSRCGRREMNKLSIKSEFRARLVTQADRRGTQRRKNVSGRTRASSCKWAAIREHLNNLWALLVALHNRRVGWRGRGGLFQTKGTACLLWIPVLLCLTLPCAYATFSSALALSDQSKPLTWSRNWCRYLC